MKDELRDWICSRWPSEKSESPIEQLFYASLMLMSGHLLMPSGVVVEQQASVGNYRADVLLHFRRGSEVVRLVVEIDGHDYHERTKEQASKDKARDRWMTGSGIHVMRFTGSDVWRNPFACVAEVADRVHQLYYGMTAKRARQQAGLDAIARIVSGD